MRFIFLGISASIGLAIFACPPLANAQYNRDYVFTDEDGHLVLRFASREAGELDPDQMYEISNAEFSSMVHDRIRADLRFDAEPIDTEWAHAMQPRLKNLVSDMDVEFDAIFVECRSASCRLVLEETTKLMIPEHQALMEIVQHSIQSFIEANPASFNPVFLIAAYDQDREIPSIKAYLMRAAR